MGDVGPEALQGDERATLHSLLQYSRESLVRKVEDVSDDDARRRMVPSGTTLLWLVKHASNAELLWCCVLFADDGTAFSDDTVVEGDTVAAAVAAYRATWARADAVVFAAGSLEDVCRSELAGETPANLRWVLAHLIEETARHAGHADILRELLDGSTGR
jgi:hypothetical protein